MAAAQVLALLHATWEGKAYRRWPWLRSGALADVGGGAVEDAAPLARSPPKEADARQYSLSLSGVAQRRPNGLVRLFEIVSVAGQCDPAVGEGRL